MPDEHDPEPEHVTRSVDLEAGVDDVWRAVADPGERALWLDDADAATRRVRIDEVSDPGAGGARRLVWTWWRPDDEGDASTVAVVVAPRTGGGTRVVVTESLPAAAPIRAEAGTRAARAARTPGWAHAVWDHRLLGLELLFLAARAPAHALVRV
ncbi:MAG TPA: hypothetical protein VKB57_25025 [Acidimicrobiales bacterium]|nr:hypothetical protein [Acidimicrobiales bacterium]